MKHQFISAFAAVAVLAPVCAFAQPALTALNPPAGVITQFKSGAFAVVPTFELVSIGTDTNVLNSDGQRERDFTASVRPGVEIGLRQEKLTLVARPRLGYVFYSRHPGERALNPQFELGVERRFSNRFAMFGGGNVTWSKEREGLEIDTRARVLDDAAILGTRLTGRRVRVELAASMSDRTYDRDATFNGESLSLVLDRRSTDGGASLAYRLTPVVSLTARTTGAFDRFRNLPARDMNRWSAQAGAEFGRRALIRGNVSAGYQWATPLDATVTPFRGLIGSGGVGWTWHDRVDLSAGVERNLDYSYQSTRFYYVYNTAEAGIRAAIRARYDVGVRASYGLLDYAGGTDTAGTDTAGTATRIPAYQERLREVTGTVGVRLKHGLRVGMYVSEWRRYEGLRPYRSTRTGIEISVGKLNVNSRGVLMSGPGR